MRGPFEDTATIDVTSICEAEARELERRYGVVAWWGIFTCAWWALVDRTWLVEAPTPARLGEQILAARRRAA
ncbi:hypothetical protein [Actinomadura rubrisoli]|uniref:Uncharacterized protein n=1 Tax=Actinomadura rubrisoli TaxID=2530368 RepID=A0A4R5ATZ6_9ACTN|nr:hypothetical protein [Actinomadura rubrisoli]TDD76213.1 hypothetical protein E1298_30920 [Actinomadura rubrisoli]